MTKRSIRMTRRRFLKATACAVGAPPVLPASVFGADTPGNRLTVACIGVGRMVTGDLNDLMGRTGVQVVVVCDVDAKRLQNAKATVEKKYAASAPGGAYKGCATHGDFRELLARPDIDVVQIVTPDHWHAIPAIEAAKAGKDIFPQKPMTYSLEEGRVLSDTIHRC